MILDLDVILTLNYGSYKLLGLLKANTECYENIFGKIRMASSTHTFLLTYLYEESELCICCFSIGTVLTVWYFVVFLLELS